jgi:5-methylcytosine-specific restriction endonuclease McrA
MITIDQLFKRDGRNCYYCGRRTFTAANIGGVARIATRDHKIPISRGGSDSAENIVLACMACNRVKGRMTDIEFEAQSRQFEQMRLDAEWVAAHPTQRIRP